MISGALATKPSGLFSTTLPPTLLLSSGKRGDAAVPHLWRGR